MIDLINTMSYFYNFQQFYDKILEKSWTKHFKIDLYKAVITDKVLFTFSVSLSEKSNTPVLNILIVKMVGYRGFSLIVGNV